jgi:nucleotide-binding universal stress UspA family protein
MAKRAAERVGVLFPAWTVSSCVQNSSPYSALLQLAEEWKADLLMVGSHGRSALGRALFGSVSHFVVNHATCSVRIARSPLFVPDAPVRLVIGLDGSEDSLTAVEEVAQRTWPAGTEARVITALDYRFLSMVPNYDFPSTNWNEPVDMEMRKSVEVTGARACARLSASGISAQSFVRDGNPKYVLLEEAEQWQADSIFLGAKGHSALERFLVGSVSASVALHARCSVEIARPRGH